MNAKTLMPTRIVVSENTEYAENLLIEKPLQPGFSDKDCTVIKKGGFVVLDFGKEICGGIGAVVFTTGISCCSNLIVSSTVRLPFS